MGQETENVTNNEVETNVDNTQVEQVDTSSTGETQTSQNFLDQFREYAGEKYDEKYENTFEKFKNEDGNLDENKLFEAYRNLEKLNSKKAEAPENYELSYLEDITEEYQFKEDDKLMSSMTEKAKELGLSNDQFNGLVNQLALFGKEEAALAAQLQAEQQAKFEEEAKKMMESIPDFHERFNKTQEFLKGSLEENQFKAVESLLGTKEGIEVVESFMSKMKDTKISIGKGGEEKTVVDGDFDIQDLYSQRAVAERSGNVYEREKIQRQIDQYYS